MAVMRKTYGWKKKKDDIVASQLAEMIGVQRPHVSVALADLERMNVIHRSRGQFGPKSMVEVNKHYRMWSAVPTSAGKVDPDTDEVPNQYLQEVPNRYTQEVPNQYSDEVPNRYSDEDSGEIPEKTDEIPANPCVAVISDDQEYQNGTPSPEYQNGTSRSTESVLQEVPNQYTQKKVKEKKERNLKPFDQSLRDRFDIFWLAWPKKVKKKDALAAFEKIAPGDVLFEKIMAGLDAAKRTEQWQDKGFIKNPDAWLKGERWEDEHRIAYTEAQIALMASYNESLGDICGHVNPALFSEARSHAMDAFLAFTTKPEDPDRWSRWFPWVAANADVPPRAGFDFLISRDGFAKTMSGQFPKGSR